MSSFAATLVLIIGLASHASSHARQTEFADAVLNYVTPIITGCFSQHGLSLENVCGAPDRVRDVVLCSYNQFEEHLQLQAKGKRQGGVGLREFRYFVPNPDSLSDLVNKVCDLAYGRVNLDFSCLEDDEVWGRMLSYFKCLLDAVFQSFTSLDDPSANPASVACLMRYDTMGCLKDFLKPCQKKTSDWMLAILDDTVPPICQTWDPEIVRDEM